MNWSYVQSHFYLASKERLYDLWGRENDSELVRAENRENGKGPEPKIEGFSGQRFCILANTVL